MQEWVSFLNSTLFLTTLNNCNILFILLLTTINTTMVNDSPKLCWLVDVDFRSFQFLFCHLVLHGQQVSLVGMKIMSTLISCFPSCLLQTSANNNSLSVHKSAVSSLASCCCFSLCFWCDILSLFYYILVIGTVSISRKLFLFCSAKLTKFSYATSCS